MFSWVQTKQSAIKKQIDIAKIMAKSKCNSDFNTHHPDWCRDAAAGHYSQLTKQVKEQVQKQQKQHEDRMGKING